MLSRIRERLTYANVVATLALVVAVAGGTTAIAITAAKNSVTTKSIKAGNVTARDIAGIVLVRETVPLADAVATTASTPPPQRSPNVRRAPGCSRAVAGQLEIELLCKARRHRASNAWFVVCCERRRLHDGTRGQCAVLPESPAKPYRDPATASRD